MEEQKKYEGRKTGTGYRKDSRDRTDRGERKNPGNREKRDRHGVYAERKPNPNNRRPNRQNAYGGSGKAPYEKAENEKIRKPMDFAEETEEEAEAGIHGDLENGAVIGRNAVRELLKAGRPVDKLLVQKGERTGSITVLVAQAIDRGIPVIETEKSKLDAVAGYAPHQGVIAYAAEKEYVTVEDILGIAEERGEAPFLILCDGITDPYNLGAIIRSAECCGAHGLVISKRRAVGLTPLVSKASAGAIEHLAVAKVANIASTVELLKEKGIWTYAAEAGGSDLYHTDLRGGIAIVMGSEGAGVSPIVRKTCDGIISIPMYGKVNSFNVSAAAAILLTEAARQHHQE